jgi:AraC-like DNA-binding protein
MAHVPPARHLLRAKDLADGRYFEPLGVDDLAAAAGLSRAHFSREFRCAFGGPPHSYLLTRRLERAAALLRTTDYGVDSSFRDPSGNHFRVTQVCEEALV